MRIPAKTIAALLVLGVSVPAFAAGDGMDGPRAGHEQRDFGPRAERGDDGSDGWGPRHHWHHHGKYHQGMRQGGLWRLAGGLAAAETALGITNDQQDAWRAFTTAMMNFAETAKRPGMGDRHGWGMHRPGAAMPDQDDADDADDAGQQAAGDQDGGAAAADTGRKLTDLPQVRMLNRMIDARTRQADAGQKLRTALDNLSSVLRPEQVRTAARLLAEQPHPGWRMHGGRHGGWHGFGGPDRGPAGAGGPEGHGPDAPPPPPPAAKTAPAPAQ